MLEAAGFQAGLTLGGTKKDIVIVHLSPEWYFKWGKSPQCECGERSLGETMRSSAGNQSWSWRPAPPRLPWPFSKRVGGRGGIQSSESRKRKRERGGLRTRRNREEATGQSEGGAAARQAGGSADCLPTVGAPGLCVQPSH